jgi:hypothetical protein
MQSNMNTELSFRFRFSSFLIFSMFMMFSARLDAQQGGERKQAPATGTQFQFGIHADPLICWFGSDNNSVSNRGARPGFNFGITINKYFGPNYAFSTGLSLVSAGGRLVSSDSTTFYKQHQKALNWVDVMPGEAITYKIQYLSIPLGLKLQTNQIGYYTFFTNIGIDPKVVIGGKADIPSLNMKNENAMEELRLFNLGYHITAGMEYGVGGNTAIVLGLGFENNFFDVTKDRGSQPVDKITHKILSFRFGVNF